MNQPAPASSREWTIGRVRAGLKNLGDIGYMRHQYRTRLVKTRYGLATVDDYLIDHKYGGRCGGTYRGRWDAIGYRGTSSAHYLYLRRIFREGNLKIGPDDVLIDVGSGKGRVLNFWLDRGFTNRMIGVEIDERFANYAADRLARFHNVEVVCGDIFDVFPQEGTVYYIFNPFKEDVTERFKDLVARTHRGGRPATVVYYMANFANLFESDPSWEVTRISDKVFHPAIIARLVDGTA